MNNVYHEKQVMNLDGPTFKSTTASIHVFQWHVFTSVWLVKSTTVGSHVISLSLRGDPWKSVSITMVWI